MNVRPRSNSLYLTVMLINPETRFLLEPGVNPLEPRKILIYFGGSDSNWRYLVVYYISVSQLRELERQMLYII